MRLLPRISLPAHGLLELVAGLGLVVAALVADLGGAGTVLVFGTGALLAGIGLGAADALPINAHQALDRTLAVAAAVAAVVAAGYDGMVAAIILLATAAGLLALEATTRWSRPLRTAR